MVGLLCEGKELYSIFREGSRKSESERHRYVVMAAYPLEQLAERSARRSLFFGAHHLAPDSKLELSSASLRGDISLQYHTRV